MKKILLLLALTSIFFSCKRESVKVSLQTDQASVKKKKINGAPLTGGGTTLTATQITGGVQLDYNIDTTDHGFGNYINWFNISRTTDTTDNSSWVQVLYWSSFNSWPILPSTFVDPLTAPGTYYYYIRPVWTMGEAPGALASVTIQ